MKQNQPAYSFSVKLSSLLMLLALIWLTVCTPVLYASIIHQQKYSSEKSEAGNRDETNSNPLTNTTEEKAPAGFSLNEEYLHHTPLPEHPWFGIVSQKRIVFSVSVYHAWHGEMHSPPPNS